jgi:hypothetical protein
MLNAAVIALCIAMPVGMWLGSLHLLRDEPPSGLSRVGVVHGSVGAVCVALLWMALLGPDRRGVGHGAGAFGWVAFGLLAATLAGGLTILSFYLRHKTVPRLLVATHASVGIAGAVMLAAYFSAPVSYGR